MDSNYVLNNLRQIDELPYLIKKYFLQYGLKINILKYPNILDHYSKSYKGYWQAYIFINDIEIYKQYFKQESEPTLKDCLSSKSSLDIKLNGFFIEDNTHPILNYRGTIFIDDFPLLKKSFDLYQSLIEQKKIYDTKSKFFDKIEQDILKIKEKEKNIQDKNKELFLEDYKYDFDLYEKLKKLYK